MKEIKSPLRYPGGKSKAIAKIVKHLPPDFSEYREPFVGGGALFIYLKQKFPMLKIWINDLNYDLFCFWKVAQSSMDELVAEIWKIKNSDINGKDLFLQLTEGNIDSLSDFERAVRFFVLNRITFSGTVDCGGFSQKAFEQRFTNSSIERLYRLKDLLEKIVITNRDYSEVLVDPGHRVFIFLDPPYLAATKSKLYGKKGDLHTRFDHAQFAEKLKNCHHDWLITYDDSPEIRENFHFANLYEWEMQYGMNNYMQSAAAKGNELFITNYSVEMKNSQQLELISCKSSS
jgi:DNA adenine methylase